MEQDEAQVGTDTLEETDLIRHCDEILGFLRSRYPELKLMEKVLMLKVASRILEELSIAKLMGVVVNNMLKGGG